MSCSHADVRILSELAPEMYQPHPAQACCNIQGFMQLTILVLLSLFFLLLLLDNHKTFENRAIFITAWIDSSEFTNKGVNTAKTSSMT